MFAYALADLVSFYSLVPTISVILEIDQLENSDLIIFPINRDSIPFVLIILFFKGFFYFSSLQVHRIFESRTDFAAKNQLS